jgi:hypothetical protein
MPQTRRQHRSRTTGPLADPTAEKAVREIYQGLPAGVTQIIEVAETSKTHTLTFKNGVLVKYEVT